MRIFTDNIERFTGTLEENKAEALNIIKENFISKLEVNTFDSNLGFTVQNRRGKSLNDLQNIDTLIDLGIVLFKDANNVMQNLTIEQMRTIKQQMGINGVTLYQTKFQKETDVNNCTTIEEVWNVNLSF